jgi:glycosyltransferase involved in cell wall biosynthesis
LKICFISSEIFAWGKYGGFGRATRMLGRELARRGHEVSAVVPLRGDQRPVEILDGIQVLGFRKSRPLEALPLYRQADAEVYHSQQPSLGTYLALRALPSRKHIVTSRDPKDFHDWWLEVRSPSKSRLASLVGYAYENNPLVGRAVRRCHGVYYAARFLEPKVRRVYGASLQLGFLPTPVEIPATEPVKSTTPTVCFVARWDRRKRPELFFELARAYRGVHFIALGQSQDTAREHELRARFADIPNLELVGFINQFTSDHLSEILSRSWILVNTATREGLPTSFLEALAHRCALLSYLNPEDTASRFGFHAREGELMRGLDYLLEHDRWRERGELGFRYVREHYELGASVDRHLEVYEAATQGTTLSKSSR